MSRQPPSDGLERQALRRVRAAASLLAVGVWALAATPRQAANVREHLRFAREHFLDPVGRIRREQYGQAFQAAVERIAAEIPPGAEYRLVESRNPDCDSYWIRSALTPRWPRSLGPESELRREDLESLLAESPRVFVVGCAGGAPALLSPAPPPGGARP
jgi:hypothetical protein